MEVNLELSVALIEEHIEARIMLEYFWKYRNQSLEVQSDNEVK